MLYLLPVLMTLAGAALTVGAVLFAFYKPARNAMLQLIRIKSDEYHRKTTTPIQRELELIAAPQKVIETAQKQVRDLQGRLVHQRILVAQRKNDLDTAEDGYFEAGASATEDQIELVAEMEQRLSIEQQTHDSIEEAVRAACGAVKTAVRELRAVQLKVVSDEARSIATNALSFASQVIQSAQSISTVGGAIDRESQEIAQEFERANATFRLNDDSPESRLNSMERRAQLDATRQRLESRRAARATANS